MLTPNGGGEEGEEEEPPLDADDWQDRELWPQGEEELLTWQESAGKGLHDREL